MKNYINFRKRKRRKTTIDNCKNNNNQVIWSLKAVFSSLFVSSIIDKKPNTSLDVCELTDNSRLLWAVGRKNKSQKQKW